MQDVLFTPVKGVYRFLALFADGLGVHVVLMMTGGGVGVWDVGSGMVRRRDAKPKDTVGVWCFSCCVCAQLQLSLIGWATGESAVVATADGL